MRCLLLVLTVALGCSAPAQAAELIPIGNGLDVIGGPVFAGERVAWGEQGRGMSDRVVVRDPGGRRSVLATFAGREPGRSFALRASAERIGVVHVRVYRGGLGLIEHVLATGRLGGPLGRLDVCSSGTPAIDVAGDAFAQRCADEVRVVTPAAGIRRFPVAGDEPFALAGGVLAIRTREEVQVVDVASGERRLTVSAPVRFAPGSDDALDVREDGTVVFGTDGSVAWASPSEPYAHPLSFPRAGGLRLAGDLVAAAQRDPAGLTERVQVRSLRDEAVAQVDGANGFDLDDAGRLAYQTKPCALSTVVVLGVREAQPNLGTRCGRPRIGAGPLRFDAARRVAVTIRCPQTARAGCGNAVELCPPRRPELCAVAGYAVAGGQARRVRVHLDRDVRRHLRAQARPVLIAETGGARRRLAVALRR